VTIKSKAPSFEPFGDELNAEVALLQAANALDLAVYLAVQSQNVEKLLDATAMWIGLGERLASGFGQDDEEEDEPVVDNPRKPKFGFHNDVTSQTTIDPPSEDDGIIVEDEDTNEEENTEDA
jgi:hypothetical protein